MKLLTVQKEIADILGEVNLGESQEDKFWIAIRDSADEDHLEYGDVRVESTPQGVQLSCDNFTITQKGPKSFFIEPPGRLCTAPSQSLDIRLVLAAALTRDASTLLAGTDQGTIIRFDTESKKEIDRIDNAHFSQISMLRAFPSDKVLLSAGSDYQIRIWDMDLQNKEPARTFKQQRKRITDVALIGSGRNFVLTSEDGSAVLWECGSGKGVSTFRRIDNHEDPALCVVVSTTDIELAPSDVVSPELQFECEDKTMYVGYHSGLIQEFRVASHSQTSVRYKRLKDASVTALAVQGKDTLIAGYSDGTIAVWGRQSETPKHEVSLNPSFPIKNMVIKGSSVVFDNGPELLFTMDLESFQLGQLVGLTEAFMVQLIAVVENSIVVATSDEIVSY